MLENKIALVTGASQGIGKMHRRETGSQQVQLLAIVALENDALTKSFHRV